jgi:Trypsin-like peptidase domain
MLLHGRSHIGLLFMLAFTAPTFADTIRDRILHETRKQVMALRVWGKTSGLETFDANEPPIYGTGFLAKTALNAQSNRYIILTAAHVVRNDRAWASEGNGSSRLVFPYAELAFGRIELGGYRGVQTHNQRDIAQVAIAEPTDRSPVTISSSRLIPNKRYFVVSWGDAYSQISRQEEPYIKEVKYLGAAPDNSGLIEIEAIPDQDVKEFKRSESGSPVYDEELRVVAMVVEQLMDNRTGDSRIGRALQLSDVMDWLDNARRLPVKEPPPLRLVGLVPPGEVALNVQNSVENGCVFIGKFSARTLPESSPQLKELAPFGKSYLVATIQRFDDRLPDRIADADAYAEVALPESDTIRVDTNTEVNFRKGCPTPVPKPQRTSPWQRNAFYGPVATILRSSQTIRVRKIVRLSYLEDFFYWGIVQSGSLEQR